MCFLLHSIQRMRLWLKYQRCISSSSGLSFTFLETWLKVPFMILIYYNVSAAANLIATKINTVSLLVQNFRLSFVPKHLKCAQSSNSLHLSDCAFTFFFDFSSYFLLKKKWEEKLGKFFVRCKSLCISMVATSYKVVWLIWKSYRVGATVRNGGADKHTHTNFYQVRQQIFLIILIRQPTSYSRGCSDGHDICKSHQHSNWDRALSNKLHSRERKKNWKSEKKNAHETRISGCYRNNVQITIFFLCSVVYCHAKNLYARNFSWL